jgi:Sulfatase
MKTKILLNTFAFCTTALAFLSTGPLANAQAKKPNILIIWGDDIGQFNISAYNMGMMGYQTPNIDRLAKEGAIFTDWYGQQSCTAGRSAFITGSRQSEPVSPRSVCRAHPRV